MQRLSTISSVQKIQFPELHLNPTPKQDQMEVWTDEEKDEELAIIVVVDIVVVDVVVVVILLFVANHILSICVL